MKTPRLRKLILRLATGFAFALVALAIFQWGVGILAVCFYSVFTLAGISWIMTTIWIRPLRVERELSADVVRIGEPVAVTAKIQNRSPWPILWLYAEETLPRAIPREGTWRRLMFIPPGRSFHLSYKLTPNRRGCHPIGPLVLESGDVFGLFKRARIDRRRDWITCLPNYYAIDDFQVGRRRQLGDLRAIRSILDDPSRVQGIREYRRGDPMKIIHWKSTARTGRLCSKVFEPVTDAGATVILDFHQDSWLAIEGAFDRRPPARPMRWGIIPAARRLDKGPGRPATKAEQPPEETAVEVVCTTCRYIADAGWRLGFFCNGRDPLGLPGVSIAQARATDSLRAAQQAARRRRDDDRLEPIRIPPQRGPEQFALIHEQLGRIELSDGLRIEDLLLLELPHIDRTQALVVVTGHVTDDFIRGMLRVRASGYRLLVFVVRDNRGHDHAFEHLAPAGIELYRMDEDWRLREIAIGRQFA
ncbi:MAG TPA: DUF58 domain-containing protein [Candidatus Sumerlaeota bacterium]|mgnify:CR=1 FL=1|nr:MAG: hypothetical protein BWZ08_01819 [candidate division BRC1 bacterium ADurb.BinA292]HPK02910.1 DUF58 domain-containing protein [Candidatus Sumerlaeota bacterium]